MNSKIIHLSLAILLALPNAAICSESSVRVRRGDTLSALAERYLGSPIYGTRGSLRRLMNLNPQVLDPSFIQPNQIVLIQPFQNQARSLAQVEQTADSSPRSETTVRSISPERQSQNVTPSIETDVEHRLNVQLGSGFRQLEAVDTTTRRSGRFESKFDVFGVLAWQQAWSSKDSTFAQIGAEYLEFNPTSNPQKTLVSKSQLLTSLVFGYRRDLSSKLNMSLSLGYEQLPFVYGLSTSTLSLVALALPQANLSANLILIQQGTTVIALSGAASLIGQGATDSFSVETGYDTSLGLSLRKRAKSEAGSENALQIKYAMRSQPTSIAAIDDRRIWFNYESRFPIFEGNQK